jgi:hypothetical protein
MDDQVKRLTVAESNGGEVTHIARREASDAERLGERHDPSTNPKPRSAKRRSTSIALAS